MEESKTEPQGVRGDANADLPTREVRAQASRSRPSPSPSVASEPSDLGNDGAYELDRGTRIERYILLKPLGQGGMGVVYSAYDPDLDRKVAVKLLRPDKRTPDGNTERAWMLREAQAMARIAHPNVIAVYDTGTFGSQIFVAMEFIQGRTLSTWIRNEQHSWQEILRVFLEAGRGLTAAHKAGLVHRDFKPSNVLIGEAGRVCVLDFGLARLAQLAEAEERALAGGDEELAELAGEPLALALPDSDLLMGTPQYMPPEQYLGTNVDARADQFSFCAAMYWALYRKRPFEPRQVARSAAESSRGTARTDDSWKKLPHASAAREPPSDSKIPSWVRKAVMRGLSLHPDDRFPSMDALLEALAHEQRRVQKRSALAAAGVLAVAAAGVGGYIFQQSRVCAGADSLVASAWGPESHKKLEAAFLATGKPFAQETAQKVMGVLDGYASQWAGMHTEACEATRVRGEQTEELLSMRMVCLDRRRKDLSALSSQLVQADGKVVERAVEAAAALPSLQPCEDIASLAEQPPLPADPKLRATIEQLGGKIAEVKALHDAGRYKAGVELAQKIEPEVVASTYAPLQAELRYHLGWLLQQSGEVDEGIRQLELAFDSAEASRSDRIRLEVLTKLIFVLVNNGHPENAERWGVVATAILKRLGGDPMLAIDLMGNRGYVALQRGRYQEAKDAFERARALVDANLKPDHPKHAKVSHGLGLVALKMGDHANAIALLSQSLKQTESAKGALHPEAATRHAMLASAYRESGQLENALTHVQKALDVRKVTQGPEHPDVAGTMDELGMSQIALARYDDAVKTFQEALELKRKALGEDHLDLSYSYDGVGQALLAGGKPAEAVEPLRKALAYKDTEPELLAQAGFALAKALWQVGGKPEQARDAARQARELYVKLEKPQQEAEIATWLSAHQEEAPTKPAPSSKKQRFTKRKPR
jgi:tetratricopeptide (TPR) repeat protein/tRNA A-37 threonylcarbamoyl transferase component Bud32